jgi:hypothetical protein
MRGLSTGNELIRWRKRREINLAPRQPSRSKAPVHASRRGHQSACSAEVARLLWEQNVGSSILSRLTVQGRQLVDRLA